MHPPERTVDRIVAVGYEFDFRPLTDLLEKHRPGITALLSDRPILSGVYYAHSCRGVHPDDCKTDAELEQWFKKRIGRNVAAQGKLRRLAVSKKGDVVVGEVQFAADRIYTFILNTASKSTSVQKKLIHNNDQQFRFVDIEGVVVTARPYRHDEREIQQWKPYDRPDGSVGTYWETLRKETVIRYE